MAQGVIFTFALLEWQGPVVIDNLGLRSGFYLNKQLIGKAKIPVLHGNAILIRGSIGIVTA